jgi:hypothetical protein
VVTLKQLVPVREANLELVVNVACEDAELRSHSFKFSNNDLADLLRI